MRVTNSGGLGNRSPAPVSDNDPGASLLSDAVFCANALEAMRQLVDPWVLEAAARKALLPAPGGAAHHSGAAPSTMVPHSSAPPGP